MFEKVILKIRRGETPFYRRIRDSVKTVRSSTLPLPRSVNPVLAFGYFVHSQLAATLRGSAAFFYMEPLFRGRCKRIGARFNLSRIPFVVGHTVIEIGDDVNFFGKVDIFSGRLFDEPLLVLGDRVDIGHNVTFVVNKEIFIESDVKVASGARFMDTDSHPKDTKDRIANLPPRPEEVKPIRICRYAWIGQNAFIMKGVTVGEGAVVGVNSVVLTDVPPYAVVMGNPARVIMKNIAKVTDSQIASQSA